MATAGVAVLDLGKSSLRVSCVDAEGAVVAERRTASRARPGPPYPHLDLEADLEWSCGALAELAREHAIEAVVPVAHGAAAGLIDEDALVVPVLDYEADLPPLGLPRDAFAETLSPALPRGLNLATQLAWLSERFPAAFGAAQQLLLLPQLIAWRLGGRPVSEVTSLGCHTHLWSPAGGRPSRLAQERGWAALLPPLVPAWEIVGTLRPELARRTGLDRSCRIHAGIHDSNASYLAHRRVRQAPFAVVSTGTWIVCMAHGATLDCLDPGRDMLANVDALGDPIASMRFPGGREIAALSGAEGLACAPELEELQALLDAGLMALPAFSDAGGAFAGCAGRVLPDLPAAPRARAALAALYAALRVDLCLDELGASGDAIVEGPLATHRAFLAALAALRDPSCVLRSTDRTGTARGAALLARWDRPPRPPATEVVPRPSLRGLDRHRERWREQLAALPGDRSRVEPET